jgi:fructosamine-3-kinase
MQLSPLLFSQVFGDVSIKHISALSGGSINHAFHAVLEDSREFFIKKNSIKGMEGMFSAESEGLKILKKAGANCPDVIAVHEIEDEQFLVLSYHPPKGANKPQWKDAGEMLAKLHKTRNEKFGLNHDNFMGSLAQKNCETSSFSDFFVNSRLLPQVKLARDSKKLNAAQSRHFDLLFEKLEDLIPQEKPSLIHGDLWIGNFHETANGVMLIDPATAFSHREVDLAMSKLFGSPPIDFYKAYELEFPIEHGFEERVSLFNLYPLLIHLNLFGETYLDSVQGVLKYYL